MAFKAFRLKGAKLTCFLLVVLFHLQVDIHPLFCCKCVDYSFEMSNGNILKLDKKSGSPLYTKIYP
jgi:hypothetical protein